MSPADISRQQFEDGHRQQPVRCEACESALHSATSHSVSVLLLDELTIPLIGCDDHLERFASVCGLTTDGTAELLDHRPAGGIVCPGCRLAPNSPSRPMLPVQDGVVVPFACPEHQAALVNRFHTGLDTEQQLTMSLDTPD